MAEHSCKAKIIVALFIILSHGIWCTEVCKHLEQEVQRIKFPSHHQKSRMLLLFFEHLTWVNIVAILLFLSFLVVKRYKQVQKKWLGNSISFMKFILLAKVLWENVDNDDEESLVRQIDILSVIK
jgi:hypothetical protein